MMSFAAKMRSHEYVEALEEERKKIMVFQRELPLCLEIITQVIESSKQQQMSGTTTTECMHGGQSECSEHTSSEAPLELVFLKKNSAKSESDDDSDEQHSHKNNNNNDHKRKADWLRLGTQTTLDLPSNEEHVPRKLSVIEAKRNGGAFQPFNREKNVVKTNNNQLVSKAPSSVPAASTGSSVETGTAGNGGNVADKKDDKGQTQRKQRRCWSPELHRRFLQALQQLGGPDAATPKQIREHMKVDGLTNDEVKSHLQKYRLHTRRVSPTIHNNGTSSQAPQLVLVGSLWMPPEYSTMAATGEASNVTTPPNGIYAPVATSPAPKMQKTLAASLDQKVKQNQSESFSSEEKCSSHSEGHAHSNSPSTSSSTHTTTASPLS